MTVETENDRENMRLGNLLEAFEAELHDLGKLAEAAQTTLSTVLSRAAHDPVCHRDAQVLDLLTQRLFGMSGFLNSLTPTIPENWRVNTAEAVKTVSLGHLVDRLGGAAIPGPVPDVGELEMF